MSENPRETFRRLHAIANGAGANEQERENARRVMDRYVAKYGDEVSIPETETEIDRDVKYDHRQEELLAYHTATFTGCETLQRGKRLFAGRKNEKFRPDGETLVFRGPESAVLSAVELYEHHRAKLRALLATVSNGYRHGAMPLPPTDGPSSVVGPHLAAALRAATQVGKTHSLTNTLTAKAGG